MESATLQANTLNFRPTSYNLHNLLDSSLDYGQFYPGVITTYPNNGPQEYLKILVNPLIDQGTPSPTANAPYGLSEFIGSVYLHDVFLPDPNNPEKYIYQSSTASTDPDYFSFLKEKYPELPPGYLILQGNGANKLFGTETADITQVTKNGVIHITSVGTINITGGEGIFEGATGTLTFLEKGISGLPYLGKSTIKGTINVGLDSINGTLEDDLLLGTENSDFIPGRDGNDKLMGHLGHDILLGGQKDDFLYGQRGDDLLNGNMGNDLLIGGFGKDILTGGMGNDKFVFNKPQDGVDSITDFKSGFDSIELSLGGFGVEDQEGELSSEHFVLGTITKDENDYLLYNSAKGELFFDADGSGSIAPKLLAILTPGTLLQSSDFSWIA